MTRLSLTFFLFAGTLLQLCAQSSAEPPADFLRSMGKLYVVVAVIVIVFLGLVFYLWSMDRKLTRLENQIDNHA